jgi:Family of unknown function (DUF6049)
VAVLALTGAVAFVSSLTGTVATVSSVAGPAAAATPAAGAAAALAASGAPVPLALVSQSAWVAPGGTFDVRLRAGPGTPDLSSLAVSVAVYPCLSSVSAFDQSVSAAGPAGSPITQTTTPIAVTSLPQLGGGVFDLSMPVLTGTATAPAGAAFAIHLAASGAQCQAFPSGVFPVRLELLSASNGSVVGSITTHLVFTEATAGTQRLRVAVVLPVQLTLGPATDPSPAALLARPQAALAPPSAASVAAVSGLIGALGREPDVPVTLEASGQTLELLDAARPGAVGQLTTLAAAPSVHEMAAAPYVPVSAATLVGAGLGTELGAQVLRGVQATSTTVLHPGGAVPEAPLNGLGPWITDDPLDDPSLAALAGLGYDQVVLPGGDVSGSPVNGSTAEPFTIGPARSPLTALASDGDLAARFGSDPGDPVLAAHQLVAELAQLYYEKPNATTPRGVVVVAPSGWSPDPSFVDALLGSLANSPIVDPVTTASLFGLLPTASCRTTCRLIGSSGGGLPAAAIRTQRLRTSEFASAAPTARTQVGELGDLVLAGESENLRPGQQSAVVANAAAALDAQLGQLGVAGDRTVTLTSQRGTVPITIVSNAPYPVTATMTLTSDKLLFATGSTQWSQTVVLAHPTNAFYITVRTRTSGVFRVDVTLRSPSGALLLSSGSVDVRSTATSFVGIALTAGAVAVLAVWWVRTSLRRRARRRAEPDVRDEDEQPVPTPS